MARGTRSRDRTPTRRGSGQKTVEAPAPRAPRLPSPAQIRRTSANLPPEARSTPERRANYRAAMVRQVYADLSDAIQTPNRAKAQTPVKRPEPLRTLGVKAPAPRKAAVPERVADRKPKVTRSKKVEPSISNETSVRPTCKPRPKNNAGDGSSRRFVPWCGK